MKIHGKQPGVYEDVHVIPRPSGDFAFKLKAPRNYEPFYQLCPIPVPPMVNIPGGGKRRNPEDRNYRIELSQHSVKQSNWIFITTIRETEGLEWEHLKYDDPNTWSKWDEELNDAGLNETELATLVHKIAVVNGMSNAKLEEARERFLTESREAEQTSSFPTDDPKST